MTLDYLHNLGKTCVGSLLIATGCAGCDSVIYEDLPPCETVTLLKFKYDYNMKYADAFSNEVTSLSVWAFAEDGTLAWQTSESGTRLADEDYQIELPLPDGIYDIVAWCGLEGETPFSLDSTSPSAIHHLSTTLSLDEDENAYGGKKCDSFLPSLFHGIVRDTVVTTDISRPTTNEIVVSLVKDTNYIKVLLQNLDGRTMNADDFSFHITAANSRLDYENYIIAGDDFSYHPWNLSLGETSSMSTSDPEITSVTSLLAEMTVSRLMEDSQHELVVTRNSDNKEIIRIPLIDYLLLVKGNYHSMSNQEYLDRQDEYSMTFFLDDNNNWYSSLGIYINSWHVVPPQQTIL